MEYGVDEVAATRMKRQMIEQGLAMMGEDALFRGRRFHETILSNYSWMACGWLVVCACIINVYSDHSTPLTILSLS